MSRILAALVTASVGSWTVSTAIAQPVKPGEPVKPGVQPPRATPAPPPDNLEMSAHQRRIVRGCPVDMRCTTPMLRAAMREFEREAFPRAPSDSPWVDGDGTARRLGGYAPGQVISAKKPSDIRPDLAWMDKLTLPDIPVRWDPRIIQYLEFYKNDPRGRRIMTEWLKRQNRFKALILRELRRHQLPSALLYVAMIESAYDPDNYSRVGASGLWQFMPSSGKIYGLRQSRWLDERNDFVRATRAASYYMKDLFDRFGDWNLALAAYNAGYGAVLKAISKYNTNDFWRLLSYESALPWESSVYVPKALACAIVGLNRAAFGYDKIKADPMVSWDTVTVPKTTSLASIARAAGVKTSDIQALNPQLRSTRTPPDIGEYKVRIPAGTRDAFARQIPQLRGEWDQVDVYVARHGERFEDIATEFGISRADLRELNGIKTEAEVRGGTLLVVPKRTSADREKNKKEAEDNLYAGGVPRGNPGDKLIVAVPDPDLKVPGRKRVFYRVTSGDTLWDVSVLIKTPVADITKWNGLDPEAHLQARMVLQLWVKPDFDPGDARIKFLDESRLTVVKVATADHLDRAEKLLGRERIKHTVKRGETLTSIGARYGLSARSLSRINKIPPFADLEDGSELIVYKVVDPKASGRAAEQAFHARQGKVKRLPRSKKRRIRRRAKKR
jgi:membrane-bound lytic murein transglycosylase D